MNMEASVDTDRTLHSAVERFADHPRILIALDFDGCVAELVSNAADARPVPANAEAIAALAELDGVDVAYVSGRSLESLRELAQPPEGVLLIGSHGAEKDLGEDAPGLELSTNETLARGQIISTLEEVAADAEGAWVEHKPAGAALHVRNVNGDQLGEQVLEHGRAALSLVDGAYLKNGKKVLESVVVLATKGEGITELRQHTGADAVLFAGDDVTDEHGFAVLEGEDLGIKVGEGETAAGHRIAEPKDLAGVLRLIAQRRSTDPDARPTR
ncbi:trehalose-phosphatase [Nesterenkonia jeotgali]|uniref:Trehalose 6-phosphate phosphatase n=2 Tax=Nesterenkonia jeotgali TaxID=317018 RepID=A0A839FR08_9MICC|nr:trehalose-phosphatase [Nesterenkonia jeotgali]MBA8922446.1 trehalose 6-phosphate phosphatase [Nesterenkonia jeotgali]